MGACALSPRLSPPLPSRRKAVKGLA